MLYDSQERGRDFAKHSFPPQQAPDRHCAATALIPTLFSEKPQWPLTQLNRRLRARRGRSCSALISRRTKVKHGRLWRARKWHQLNNTVSSETSAYVGLKRRATRQNVTYTYNWQRRGTKPSCG